MKYSLRSLFVVVTLACVLLGGSIEYLRRMSAFPSAEAARFTHGTETINPMLRPDALSNTYFRTTYLPWAFLAEHRTEP